VTLKIPDMKHFKPLRTDRMFHIEELQNLGRDGRGDQKSLSLGILENLAGGNFRRVLA